MASGGVSHLTHEFFDNVLQKKNACCQPVRIGYFGEVASGAPKGGEGIFKIYRVQERYQTADASGGEPDNRLLHRRYPADL